MITLADADARAAEMFLSAAGESASLRLKGEADVFGFVAGDGDVFSLSAVVLMPGRDGVPAGRQVRQPKVPSALVYVVMRRLEHCEIAVHPGIDIALHRDEFFFIVFLGRQLPTTAFDASIMAAKRGVVLGFGLTLDRWRDSNAVLWRWSVLRGFGRWLPV